MAVFNSVNGNIKPGAPYRLASTPTGVNASAQPPSQLALQTDFAWGFLFAGPIYDPSKPVLKGNTATQVARDIIRENH